MTISTMLKMIKDLTDDISDQIKMYGLGCVIDELEHQLAKEYLTDITTSLFDIKLEVMPECVVDEKDDIPDLVEHIGAPAMLEQLAEECCELGKAALKQSREMRGENATHKNPDDIRNNLIEEIADVSVSIYQVVKNTGFITEEEVQEMADRKTERMKKRLEEDDEKRVKEAEKVREDILSKWEEIREQNKNKIILRPTCSDYNRTIESDLDKINMTIKEDNE